VSNSSHNEGLLSKILPGVNRYCLTGQWFQSGQVLEKIVDDKTEYKYFSDQKDAAVQCKRAEDNELERALLKFG
jgi:hypothetical protein